MKKIKFLIAVLSCVMFVVSCNKKQEPTPEKGVFIEAKAYPISKDKAWAQYSGTAFSQNFNITTTLCYNAMGTNQSNKRFNVFVTKDTFSNPLYVEIWTSYSGCPSTQYGLVRSYFLNTGHNSFSFDVSGLPSQVVNIQVKIKASTGQTYSGTCVASYEY